MKDILGKWAFILGVILAVILGLIGASLGGLQAWLVSLLIVFGLIVGFLNIAGKQAEKFVFAAIVLVIASYMGGASSTLTGVAYIGPYLGGIFDAVMVFVIPAVVVVALKDVYDLAKA
tara:strand:- start:365 stop:718 length:354 start_codon:yes stop_codon:yes gene_type:complete